MRPRFQLDEQVPVAVAVGLRHRGIDVITAVDAGLRTVPDPQVLAHAVATGRVLVTHDADFVEMHRDGLPHAGIAFCAQRLRSVGRLVEDLSLMYEVMEAEELVGRLEYL